MEWVAIAKLIIDNAPAAIQTVEDGIEWVSKTWAAVRDASGKDAATITPDELVAHIANFKRSSGVIQDIP